MPPVTPPLAFTARRHHLQAALLQRGVREAALTSGWARARNFAHNVYPFRAESHFLYLTGLRREGCVLVFQDGTFRLYVTEQEESAALWEGTQPNATEISQELGLDTLAIEALPPLPHAAVLPPQDDETAEWFAALLGRDVLPQSGPELHGQDAAFADAMVTLRLVADESAVKQLSYASEISARAHQNVMANAIRETSEATVRGRFIGNLVSHHLELAYGPIVTRKGEILHSQQSQDPIRAGDLVLCDVGGETPEGWAGDVTRTWPASGKFSSTQRAIYELVLEVQLACIDHLQPGVEFRDVHERAHHILARGLLDRGIFKGSWDAVIDRCATTVFFPHGLGHLLGLDVHDMEDLGDRAGYAVGRERSDRPDLAALRLDRPLAQDMVVTIEPGFYQVPVLLDRARQDPRLSQLIDFHELEHYRDVRGIRIEDDVRVTHGAVEVLSRAAVKDPDEIEALISAGA